VAGAGSPVTTVAHHRRRRRAAVPSALTSLRSSLKRILVNASAGHGVGAYVLDISTGAQLYALRDKVERNPASVEKIYTTIASLSRMSPETRLQTTVVGAGHLGTRGVWRGDLYLKGGGDPTLGDGTFNRTWERGYGPTLAQLAQQLRAAGIRRVTGHLIADAGLFDSARGGPSTGYAPDVPDFGGQLSALVFDHGASGGGLTPEAFAARQLARTLRAQHVGVKATPQDGVAPRRGHVLARVSSPPLATLVRLMDVPSDDLIAELLAKQLGARYGHGGTITDGAHVISSIISLYGIHPTIVDGSGLSRSDLSSPLEVVDLLGLVWRTQIGRMLMDALPIVGEDGTVQQIGVATPAQGHCAAKTGTLDNVTNLAGYCSTRSHQVLAFAFFVDGPENWQALGIIGKAVAALASY
jgi:D-alanyl-D-alanine carboxypeptidase/D-alanyl-D-alanine-endopeptidase (penicillin-binding protein 4)